MSHHPTFTQAVEPRRLCLPLASTLFLTAWETTRGGRPRLHPTGIALLLAAGLLAELSLLNRLTISGARLKLRDRRPTGDHALDVTLNTIGEAPQLTDIRTWLAYLAQHAPRQVADRLITAGLVVGRTSRFPGRRLRYQCTQAAWGQAAWAADRIYTCLRRSRPLTIEDHVLLALADACGLTRALLTGADLTPQIQDARRAISAQAPPFLDGLVECLHAAVGNAVLTYRP